MNIISVLYIICSFIAFESAVTIYRLNRKAAANILFAVFSFDFSLFCILYSNMVDSPTKGVALFWHMASIPSGTLNIIFTFHFSLVLTGFRRTAANPFIMIPVYLPSFYFMFQMFNFKIITDLVSTPWGWNLVYDQSSSGYVFGVIHGIFWLTVSSAILIRWYFKSDRELEKKQAGTVAFSFLLGIIGFLFMVVIYVWHVSFYNGIISNIAFAVFFTVFILGVRFAVGRYKLMSLHPEVPVIDIIMGLHDPCFIADIGGNIVCVNMHGSELAGISGSRNIAEVFTCIENISEKMHDLITRGNDSMVLRCFLPDKKNHHERWFNLEFNCIRDRGRSITGFMIMAKGDRTLADFCKHYSITSRQAEIIMLAVSGLSNRDIAERLQLSERTIENHLFNIYNKLVIDNKLELINIAVKYNLLVSD